MYSYIIRRLALRGADGGRRVDHRVRRDAHPARRSAGRDLRRRRASPSSAKRSAPATWRELGLSDPLVGAIPALGAATSPRGNFGRSFFRSESVADMILRRGPLTAEIALIVGRAVVGRRHPGGDRQRAAAQQHRPTTSARFFSILFLAVPGFWVGMLIVLGAAVLVRLPGADGRRLAVRRSDGPICRS